LGEVAPLRQQVAHHLTDEEGVALGGTLDGRGHGRATSAAAIRFTSAAACFSSSGASTSGDRTPSLASAASVSVNAADGSTSTVR